MDPYSVSHIPRRLQSDKDLKPVFSDIMKEIAYSDSDVQRVLMSYGQNPDPIVGSVEEAKMTSPVNAKLVVDVRPTNVPDPPALIAPLACKISDASTLSVTSVPAGEASHAMVSALPSRRTPASAGSALSDAKKSAVMLVAVLVPNTQPVTVTPSAIVRTVEPSLSHGNILRT